MPSRLGCFGAKASILFYAAFSLFSSFAHAAIPSAERAALQALYAQTDGAHWTYSYGWNGPAGSECTWDGVHCDAAGEHVVKLYRGYNNQNGNLPDLSALTRLEELNLAAGQLTGTISWLPKLASLQVIDVSHNRLSGAVPPLAAITNLSQFIAADNLLTGKLPVLAGLTSLQSFDVGSNLLSGNLPALAGLQKLNSFKVGHNELDGSLPSIADLSNLFTLDVSFNQLSGTIPPFPNLLNSLQMQHNALSGALPSFEGITASSLSADLSENALSGELPSATAMTHFSSLDLHGNGFTGSIPALPDSGPLTRLDLSANHLSGTIPAIPTYIAFTYLNLSHNQLGGQVPATSNSRYLRELYLNDNLLTGSVPYINSLRFGVLDVSNNQLAGAIPDQDGAVNLSIFRVGGNSLTGAPPKIRAEVVLAPGQSSLCPNKLDQIPSATWDAATGVTPWYSACPQSTPGPFKVTPSSDPFGTISPNIPVTVTGGATATFTVDPSPGFAASMSGTCGGNLAGNVYTTNPVTANCTVIAKYISTLGKTFVTLTSSPNPSALGQKISLTATVNSSSPGGRVTFAEGSTSLCAMVSLSSGTAVCDIASLATGAHSITASYSGDGASEPSSSSLVQTVNSTVFPTAALLISSVNPILRNQAVRLQLVVAATSPPGPPTGYVRFFDSGVDLCGAKPLRLVRGSYSAYCVTKFVDIATHAIAATYSGDGSYSAASSSLDEHVAAESAFNPDQFGLTGSWYDAATSGQGLEIEILPDYLGTGRGVLFAGWFTYAGGGDGTQRWFTLQGEVGTSNAPIALDIYQATGGTFASPPKVAAAKVGSATIVFADCTHATLNYLFTDNNFGDGAIPLTRLSTNTACAAAGTNGQAGTDYFFSGAWYEAATSGQGVLVDISPPDKTLFGAWYTYRLSGQNTTAGFNQRWFTFQVNDYVVGSRFAKAVPIYAPNGGKFDDPTAVTNARVGTADIVFSSCNTMSLAYTFTEGEFIGQSGTIAMTAAGPVPKGCQY